MNTGFISTAALTEATRIALSKAQIKLVEAQKELSTGRHADVGITLGSSTARTISLRQEFARLQTIIDTNGVVDARLSLSQTTLQTLQEDAQTYLDAMIAARDTALAPGVAQTQADDTLKAFTGLMNESFAGQYIFSGINTDVAPLTNYYDTPTSAARQAVADAFQNFFGFALGSAGAGTITASDMEAFLDGPYADLFEPAAWSSTWSSASDQNVKSRVSNTELIETSANANDQAFRKLARAFTMVSDLGLDALSTAAAKVVFDKTVTLTSEAITDVNTVRSALGLAQNRATRSSERLALQKDILSTDVSRLESVDPAEVSTRLAALTVQIESSYAITARIQNLSLLNFL